MKSRPLGGISIASGAALILMTIAAELAVGWIGVERSPTDAVHFVRDHWDQISLIWSAQVVGYILWTLGFVVLLRSEDGWRSVVWAAATISGLLVIVAFVATLGAYPPALDVLQSAPELIAVIRGLVSALYRIPGVVLLLILFGVFVVETWAKDGAIQRKTGSICLVIFALSILTGFVLNIDTKVTGAVIFVFPFVLGVSYARHHAIEKQ